MADQPGEPPEWMHEGFNDLSERVTGLVERMLAQGDDRVTILGMIQSAVLFGLADAGFPAEEGE